MCVLIRTVLLHLVNLFYSNHAATRDSLAGGPPAGGLSYLRLLAREVFARCGFIYVYGDLYGRSLHATLYAISQALSRRTGVVYGSELELCAHDPSSPQPVHGRLMMPVHVGDRLADRAELHQDFHPDRRHVHVHAHAHVHVHVCERTRTMSIDPADVQSGKHPTSAPQTVGRKSAQTQAAVTAPRGVRLEIALRSCAMDAKLKPARTADHRAGFHRRLARYGFNAAAAGVRYGSA